MLCELISHSDDLKKLWDEGHAMEILQGFLCVHDVPYVNSNKEVRRGTLVSTLNLAAPDQTAVPETHVIYFIGNYPCDSEGLPIRPLFHSTADQELIAGVLKVNHSFSNKPTNGFANYYEKVTSYIRVISHPAKALDENVTEKTFQIIEPREIDSVFEYADTNSSRAEINPITAKLAGQKIAIVGLGGTGSYLLDLIAKTPVQEIHLYDGDNLLQHNAFRAPGAVSKDTLGERLKKTEYYARVYKSMHKNIFPHSFYLDGSNLNELINKDFIFVSMDASSDKKEIVEFLVQNAKSFIDTGVGVEEIEGALIGKVRITTASPIKNDHISSRLSFVENKADNYDRNIQIADLNSLSATLAVIKWKKLLGFYREHESEFNTTHSVYTNETTNEDIAASVRH